MMEAPGLGDRPTPGLELPTILREVVGLWLVTLLLIRGVVEVHAGAGLPDWVLAAVPVLFIYAPVLLCRIRGVDSFAYRLAVPAFRDGRAWGRSLAVAGKLLAAILLPWLVAYHFYQTILFGAEPALRFPADVATLIAYQVFFVAIPEEFFYRGYLLTRLNEALPRKFILAGIPFGHGLWVSSLLFAFGHSLVTFQWWHFAIFFPGLLFGLLREKTGGVLAAAFFHAGCNVMVHLLDTAYGLI